MCYLGPDSFYYVEDAKHQNNCVNCEKRKKSLLIGLSDEILESININRTVVKYKKGEYLFKPGNKIQGLFCLQKGRVKESKVLDSGKELITAFRKPVDFIAISDIMYHPNHLTYAFAMEDSEVCIIDIEDFKSVLLKDPHFVMSLMQHLAVLNLESQSFLFHLTHCNMKGRLLYCLFYLSDRFCNSNEQMPYCIEINLTHLAGLSQLTLSNMIHLLKDLENEKIISYQNKTIKIINPIRAKALIEYE